MSPDPLRLAGTIPNADVDAREVEPLGVDTHVQGGRGALPVVSAVPAMAEGTSSIKPAGGAEKATAAKLEASEPRAYDKVGSSEKGYYKARPAMESRHHHK